MPNPNPTPIPNLCIIKIERNQVHGKFNEMSAQCTQSTDQVYTHREDVGTFRIVHFILTYC